MHEHTMRDLLVGVMQWEPIPSIWVHTVGCHADDCWVLDNWRVDGDLLVGHEAETNRLQCAIVIDQIAAVAVPQQEGVSP